MKTILTAAAFVLLATASHAKESREFVVGPFDSIIAEAGVAIVLTQGEPRIVRAEAPDAAGLDKLRITVEGNRLRATRDQSLLDFILGGGLLGLVFEQFRDVTVHVTIPDVRDLEATSGASIRSDSLRSEVLRLEASSGGRVEIPELAAVTLSAESSSGAGIVLGGRCTSIAIDVSSGGRLDGAALECRDVRIDGSSGGNATIHATGEISGSLSSGASLVILGDPAEIDISASSGGHVSTR